MSQTAEEKAAAEAAAKAKKEEEEAAKAKAAEEKAAAEAAAKAQAESDAVAKKKGEPITVKYRDHKGEPTERTFSKEVHGDKFAELAEEFKATNASRIIA